MGRRVLRLAILGYSVRLCPIKRTLGLYGLSMYHGFMDFDRQESKIQTDICVVIFHNLITQQEGTLLLSVHKFYAIGMKYAKYIHRLMPLYTEQSANELCDLYMLKTSKWLPHKLKQYFMY